LAVSLLNNLAAASPTGGGPSCVAASVSTNGARVALVPCLTPVDVFPNNNTTWSVPVAPLTGPLNTFDGKCLDVPNGSTQSFNGVRLQVWDCFPESPHQLFQTVSRQIKFA
jgi:hypothetical protein